MGDHQSANREVAGSIISELGNVDHETLALKFVSTHILLEILQKILEDGSGDVSGNRKFDDSSRDY